MAQYLSPPMGARGLPRPRMQLALTCTVLLQLQVRTLRWVITARLLLPPMEEVHGFSLTLVRPMNSTQSAHLLTSYLLLNLLQWEVVRFSSPTMGAHGLPQVLT